MHILAQAHLFIIPQAFDQRLTPKTKKKKRGGPDQVDRIQMMSYLVVRIVE